MRNIGHGGELPTSTGPVVPRPSIWTAVRMERTALLRRPRALRIFHGGPIG